MLILKRLNTSIYTFFLDVTLLEYIYVCIYVSVCIHVYVHTEYILNSYIYEYIFEHVHIDNTSIQRSPRLTLIISMFLLLFLVLTSNILNYKYIHICFFTKWLTFYLLLFLILHFPFPLPIPPFFFFFFSSYFTFSSILLYFSVFWIELNISHRIT